MKVEEDSQRKILILGGILVLALSLLLLRMWYVQIYKGAGYKARIKGHSQLTVRLPAVRGEICDRNGVPLVENRASMEVEFYLPDIVRALNAGPVAGAFVNLDVPHPQKQDAEGNRQDAPEDQDLPL